MQQTRYKGMFWGLGFLVMLTAPFILGASGPSLDDFITIAIQEDRIYQNLLLDQRIDDLRNKSSDLPAYSPYELNTGQGGIGVTPHNSPPNPPNTTDTYYRLSGSPTARVTWGDSGNTSLVVGSGFTLHFHDSASESNTLNPSAQLNHRIADVFKNQTIDPDEITELQKHLNREKAFKDRISTVTSSVYSIVRSILDQEQKKISAQQSLTQARLNREQLITIQRRNPTSLTVLQADDRILAAEIEIADATAQQNIALENIRRITRIGSIELTDILGIQLPQPSEIVFPSLPEIHEFISVQQAQLALELSQSQAGLRFEGAANNLNLSVSASTNYLPNQGELGTSRISAGGTLDEGSTWSLGIELGYTHSTQLSGPSLLLSGKWAPNPSSWGSGQNSIEREIALISLEQTEIQYQNALEDAQNTLRDFETQIRQNKLSADSWARRLTIGQATLQETLTSQQAGLATQESVTEAQLNLDSLRIQGKMNSLSMLVLIQTIARNTL